MPLPMGQDLERRYRALFDNATLQAVAHARTPYDAEPVDEDAILAFVQSSDDAHAVYVRSALKRFKGGMTLEVVHEPT